MRFKQAELRARLLALGIPAWGWQLADTVYETVPDDYPQKVWEAQVDEFRANAPELLTALPLGGGKSRLVPKWIEEAGDCDDGAFVIVAKAIVGNWLNAARGGPKVARCFGLLFFTATPTAENRNRSGGHAVVWIINHAGEFKVFEDFDGEYEQPSPADLTTASFGIAV